MMMMHRRLTPASHFVCVPRLSRVFHLTPAVFECPAMAREDLVHGLLNPLCRAKRTSSIVTFHLILPTLSSPTPLGSPPASSTLDRHLGTKGSKANNASALYCYFQPIQCLHATMCSLICSHVDLEAHFLPLQQRSMLLQVRRSPEMATFLAAILSVPA